jgi:hypothetical protein
LATSYGWTEEYIWDRPWDRIQEYLDEIRLYHDQEVTRELDPLPEMAELKRLMIIKAAESKKEILKKLENKK